MRIGPFEHPSKVVVAPMAGVTDQPFRNLCRENGSHWVVSEMVTSDHRLWHTRKSAHRLQYLDENEPRWIQIAGAEPQMMAEAARLNVEMGAQIIDINMGCPAKKVCRRAAGSALMRDEKLVAEILEAVVGAVQVPVTLKIRLGWSLEEINATSIARIAEDVGVQLLTVHGRSRACKFQGAVNYHEIGRVVDAIGIPVIANGDIDTPERALAVLKQTEAAGVMIGRAAQGQPWLPTRVDEYLQTGVLKKNPSLAEIKAMLAAHLIKLSGFYGELMGPRIARKHVGWYLSSLSEKVAGKDMFLKQFNKLDSTRDQVAAIEDIMEKLSAEEILQPGPTGSHKYVRSDKSNGTYASEYFGSKHG